MFSMFLTGKFHLLFVPLASVRTQDRDTKSLMCDASMESPRNVGKPRSSAKILENSQRVVFFNLVP